MPVSADSAPALVVHGGAGASPDNVDGCETAAQLAATILHSAGEALDAVVRAVVSLEDDGRFNAGSGSVMGLDGATIEMDAAVMDSRGRLGSVACIRRVRNPVLVARAVADSPHSFLAGEGAERFARTHHMAIAPPPSEDILRRREAAIWQWIAQIKQRSPAEQAALLEGRHHPTEPPGAATPSCDTVGAVARDARGHFAVAGSTGGITPALMGRVGDTPIIGAGFYAGRDGAVAATGIGERIIPQLLAHTVYQWIADGTPLQQALERGIALFPAHVEVGLIAVSRTEAGSSSKRPMPVVAIGGRDD